MVQRGRADRLARAGVLSGHERVDVQPAVEQPPHRAAVAALRRDEEGAPLLRFLLLPLLGLLGRLLGRHPPPAAAAPAAGALLPMPPPAAPPRAFAHGCQPLAASTEDPMDVNPWSATSRRA